MPDLEDVSPSLSGSVAQSGAADAAGTIQYQSGVESEEAGDVAFAGPIADFILYGVVNGAFAQGPPDSSQNIEPVNNPLPYWSGPTQVSGGAITLSHATDVSNPSGKAARFNIAAGAASDEAYIEQIVPVGGSRFRAFGNFVRVTMYRVVASGGTPRATVAGQYLTATGATTGSALGGEPTVDLSADATAYVGYVYNTAAVGSPPSDAAFLRIRIGVQRNTMAATDTATIDFPDIRVDRGIAELLLGDQFDATTFGPGALYQFNGSLFAKGAYSNATYVQIDGGTDYVSLYAGTAVEIAGSQLLMREMAAPGTPDSGKGALYVATDGRLHFINDAGTDTPITP